MGENPELQHLRVLIANQRSDRLDHVTNVVVGLGHEVVARSIEVDVVAAVTRREQPDLALVGLGDSSEHALELIDRIVRQAACQTRLRSRFADLPSSKAWKAHSADAL